MRFLTKQEAEARASHTLGPDGLPVVPGSGMESRRVAFEDEPGAKYFPLAQELVDGLGYFDWCLLWVVLTGVWRSSQNLHLYYHLRQSYGDCSEVDERPALVALRHEAVDLVSFLNLGMLFGWEMYLVTSHDYGRAFVSHDGYFELTSSAPQGGGGEHTRATDRRDG